MSNKGLGNPAECGGEGGIRTHGDHKGRTGFQDRHAPHVTREPAKTYDAPPDDLSAQLGASASKNSPRGGPEAPAVDPAAPTVDPDLAAVVAGWPHLPQHIKAAILALVKTTEV